jgi:hypothetical protein
MATVLRSIGVLSLLALLLVFASVTAMEAAATREETTKMEEMAAPANLWRGAHCRRCLDPTDAVVAPFFDAAAILPAWLTESAANIYSFVILLLLISQHLK